MAIQTRCVNVSYGREDFINYPCCIIRCRNAASACVTTMCSLSSSFSVGSRLISTCIRLPLVPHRII